eukprot:CFRG1932T1
MSKSATTYWFHILQLALARQIKILVALVLLFAACKFTIASFNPNFSKAQVSAIGKNKQWPILPSVHVFKPAKNRPLNDVLFSFSGHRYNEYNPTVKDLHIFVRSFRRFNQHARLVIFVTNNTLRTGDMEAFLDRYNVETPLCNPEVYPYRHVIMRFFCERDYIRDNENELRNVMHSDTDVIFQVVTNIMPKKFVLDSQR